MNPIREAMIMNILEKDRDRQYLVTILQNPHKKLDKNIPIQICMMDGISIKFECKHDDKITDVITRYTVIDTSVETTKIHLYSTSDGENKIPDNTKINTCHKNSEGILVFYALPIPQMRDAILIELKIETDKPYDMYNRTVYESSSVNMSKIQVSSEIVSDDILINGMEEKQEYHLNKCNLPEYIKVFDGLEYFNNSHEYESDHHILILI
jgi:hypothetical protein